MGGGGITRVKNTNICCAHFKYFYALTYHGNCFLGGFSILPIWLKCELGLRDKLVAFPEISLMTWRNFFRFCTNILSELKITFSEFGGQRSSKNLFTSLYILYENFLQLLQCEALSYNLVIVCFWWRNFLKVEASMTAVFFCKYLITGYLLLVLFGLTKVFSLQKLDWLAEGEGHVTNSRTCTVFRFYLVGRIGPPCSRLTPACLRREPLSCRLPGRSISRPQLAPPSSWK